MRVFVTGATGFVGSAIVSELLANSHQVLGLARNDAAADSLARIGGVEVHRGDLTDLDSLTAGAHACDAVIHTAFIHDFSNWAANIEIDLTALKAMIGALEGSGKALISTSGLALHSPGQICTEDVSAVRGAPRSDAEFEVLEAAGRGVRGMLVRLPPSVHGAGDHGFVPRLIEIARQKGLAAYVGEGANRWPAVHRTDAARAYRLALEKAPAGTRLHAVAETGVPMREIAETIGAGLGLPVRSLTADEAAAHFEWFAMFAGIDCPATSAITRELLGWAPVGPDLLTDIRENGYFG